MKLKQQGFTIVELLVVIGIIAILSSIILVAVESTGEQQDILETQTVVNNVSTAIAAYYDKTRKYPDDLRDEGPRGNGVKAGYGYLVMLEEGYEAQQMQSGSLVKENISFIELKEINRFDNDEDHVMDNWGGAIQYRKCPQNTPDYKNRFRSNGTKTDVLAFPGNPKKFNLWSPGPDLSDADQEYEYDISDGKGRDYKSGGYDHEKKGASGDARDDIHNW